MKNKITSHGISLMEIMVALAIVAVLLTIAIPSYKAYMLKSRRVEAMHTLLAIQLEQEKWRNNNSTYGTLTDVWGGVTASAGGYYTLAISNVSGTSYTITATAVGDQANDADGSTSCVTLTIAYSNGTTTKSPSACWLGS